MRIFISFIFEQEIAQTLQINRKKLLEWNNALQNEQEVARKL